MKKINNIVLHIQILNFIFISFMASIGIMLIMLHNHTNRYIITIASIFYFLLFLFHSINQLNIKKNNDDTYIPISKVTGRYE